MASALSRALKEPVRHVAMSPQDYAKLGFPGADDLANMFQFNHDFADAFCAARPTAGSHALNPALMSFEAWLLGAGSQIQVPAKPAT